MNDVPCSYVDNFEKIYDLWLLQRKLGEGKIFAALGDDVLHVAVLARQRYDPAAHAPLAEWVSLIEEPDNPVDTNAILVLRQGVKIGYVPRDRTAVTKKWMNEARKGMARCVNSPKAIYFFSSENLF